MVQTPPPHAPGHAISRVAVSVLLVCDFERELLVRDNFSVPKQNGEVAPEQKTHICQLRADVGHHASWRRHRSAVGFAAVTDGSEVDGVLAALIEENPVVA